MAVSGDVSTRNFAVVSTRRIRRPAEKLRIVEEAMGPGANVSATARRHAMTPSLLRRWIKSFKTKQAARPEPEPVFAPVAIAAPSPGSFAGAPSKPPPIPSNASGVIEVVLANGRILRIGADIDMAVLKRIAAALEDQT